jgi:hypothetical protein
VVLIRIDIADLADLAEGERRGGGAAVYNANSIYGIHKPESEW